jgi:uncharacterized protein
MLAFCGILFAFQRSLIYYPQPDAGPRNADTLILAVPTTRNSVVSTAAHEGAEAVLYFGGNAEEVSQSLPDLKAAFPDRALYLIALPRLRRKHRRAFRGRADRRCACAVRSRACRASLTSSVIGRSLGSGVAVHLASLAPGLGI